MASVALTVAVMIAFFSTRMELTKFLDRLDEVPYQRLWVKPVNLMSRQTYPLVLRPKLEAVPGVQKVLYVVNVRGGKTPDGRAVIAQGGSDGLLEVERDFFPVDDASIQRWTSDRSGAIVGELIAEAFSLKVGDAGEISTDAGPLKFKVAGISRGGPFQTRVVFHYALIDELMGGKGVVHDYRIVLDKKTDSRPVVKAIDEILDTHKLASHLIGERTMMQLRGAESAGLIPNLLGALGLVLLVTTALAITNTTVISVRERRAELATLRAVGFKKRSVARMIVSEVFVVCVVGGLLGIAIAWFAMRDGLALGSSLLMSVHMTLPGLLAGVGSTLAVAIGGGVISSWLAVRAPLAQALRDAG
jgi:putative ABC transport system permease protein